MPTLSGSLNVTGSVNVTGSFTLNGNIVTSGAITSNGSAVVTAVATGSFAITGSNTFNGNQIITGSLTATGGVTASLQGTASYAAVNLQQVTNLGSTTTNDINVNSVSVWDSAQSEYINIGTTDGGLRVSGSAISLTAQADNITFGQIGLRLVTIGASFVTGSKQYELPNQSGTVALTTGSIFGTASYADRSGVANKLKTANIAGGGTFYPLIGSNYTGDVDVYAISSTNYKYDLGINQLIVSSISASFTGSLRGSSSYADRAMTASYALNASGTTIVTGSFATTGSNTFVGNQDVNGAISASGDFRFTSVGTSIVYPINNFQPHGTASFVQGSVTEIDGTNTTASLAYGINLISTASGDQYCCTLPTIPQKGKSVTVINKSGVNVRVFPSQIGGDVNGVIDGNFVIPPNNQSYVFNCYDNPLPGGWSIIVSGGGQTLYTSGEISIPITSSANFVNVSVNNSVQQSTTAMAGPFSSLGSLSTDTTAYIANVFDGFISPVYLPDTPWTKINSVQVISNLSGSYGDESNGQFIITRVVHNLFNTTRNVNNGNYNQFMFNTAYNNFINSTYVPWLNTNIGNDQAVNGAAQVSIYPFYTQYTPQFYTMPGAFVPSATSPIVSDTVGGPGTWRSKKIYPTNVPWGKKIGKNLIGTYYDAQQASNIEFYDCRSVGFLAMINPYAYTGTPFVLKLRFIINVTI
jgi:hypothetical protein